MNKVCQNCQCYCIHCQICHKQFDYSNPDDTCDDFTPEHHLNEESEAGTQMSLPKEATE